MNINRHNYEEYFILYMDNELGSDERRMVEAFVAQHPDLKDELDLLLQYKLSPDTEISFPGKEELIKVNGETPVTLTNYEEWLVLYIDNELNTRQQKEVEKFIAGHPSVQEELTRLQHTKLQPEQIFFAHKETLYRRSEKVKAFPVRWWRAVAAVLILALGLTAVMIITKNQPIVKKDLAIKNSGSGNNIDPDKTTQQIKKENPVIIPGVPDHTIEQTAIINPVNPTGIPAVKKENKSFAVKNNKAMVKDKIPATVPSAVKKEEPVLAENNKPSNNLPQPLNNPNINNNAINNDAVAGIDPSKESINPQESLTTAPVTNVIPASYTNNNDAGQLEEGGNNKKNRGFFRKLARTFEKRTNITATDDDRLLVGGLAFKLK